MAIAEPVRIGSGQGAEKVIGLLVLRIRGSSVAAILDEVRDDSRLTPFLIDGDGVIIHHLDEQQIYRSLMPLSETRLAAIRADQRFQRDRIDSLQQPVLAAAMVGAQSIGHVSYHSQISGVEEIAGYAPVTAIDWVVGVTEPRAEFEAPLQALYRNLLWSVVLVGMLFSGLALRFARSIVRPIQALTRSAHALKAGDFDNATVPVQRRDEVGQLARTFNVMIDVLRQRERERDRNRP
jgi:HAMP domain-containing protein